MMARSRIFQYIVPLYTPAHIRPRMIVTIVRNYKTADMKCINLPNFTYKVFIKWIPLNILSVHLGNEM